MDTSIIPALAGLAGAAIGGLTATLLERLADEPFPSYELAWDLLGSDFAGRHLQYEKFYAGPGFVMNSYSYLAGPWKEVDRNSRPPDGELRSCAMWSWGVRMPE